MRITPLGWLNGAAVAALFLVAYPYRDAPVHWVAVRIAGEPLNYVRSWSFRPYVRSVEALEGDPSDMLVVGFGDGTRRTGIIPDDVPRLQQLRDGRHRRVLAYLRISETPGLQTAHSCAPGPAGTRYWEGAWKQNAYLGSMSYLRRIIAAGFDGIFLDDIVMYRRALAERPTAERDMIDTVRDLAATARALKPDFLVIPANAEMLLENRDYRLAIDGIAKEGFLHSQFGTGERNPPEAILSSLARLDILRREGKQVFVIEYLSSPNKIETARRILSGLGFVATFEARKLDAETSSAPREGCSAGAVR